MRIIAIPSQYLQEFKPRPKPQVRKSRGKPPVDYKMSKGAYIPTVAEREAQAMSENQKRAKVRSVSNKYYIKKRKTPPVVMPRLFEKVVKEQPVITKTYITWVNEAGRTVRKLAP